MGIGARARRWGLPVLLFSAIGCAQLFSPIPPDAVLAAAEPLCNLGHPMAVYRDARVVGSSAGGCMSSGSHDRYVDLDVDYDRRGKLHTMRVRFYVHETEPCRITVDVLEDDGPPPILLDNPLSAEAVGVEMCKALDEARGGPPGGGA